MPVCRAKRNMAQIPKINDKRICTPLGLTVLTPASDSAILGQAFGRAVLHQGEIRRSAYPTGTPLIEAVIVRLGSGGHTNDSFG